MPHPPMPDEPDYVEACRIAGEWECSDLMKDVDVPPEAIGALEHAIVKAVRDARKEVQDKAIRMSHEIEQIAGKALGYPWYKDDQKNFPGATEANGVCVGEHVPETIVQELANRLRVAEARGQALAAVVQKHAWICTEHDDGCEDELVAATRAALASGAAPEGADEVQAASPFADPRMAALWRIKVHAETYKHASKSDVRRTLMVILQEADEALHGATPGPAAKRQFGSAKGEISMAEEEAAEALYWAAVARINVLMDAKHGTRDGEELDRLASLIEFYDNDTPTRQKLDNPPSKYYVDPRKYPPYLRNLTR